MGVTAMFNIILHVLFYAAGVFAVGYCLDGVSKAVRRYRIIRAKLREIENAEFPVTHWNFENRE